MPKHYNDTQNDYNYNDQVHNYNHNCIIIRKMIIIHYQIKIHYEKFNETH